MDVLAIYMTEGLAVQAFGPRQRRKPGKQVSKGLNPIRPVEHICREV